MSKSISAPLQRTARLLDLVPFISTHQGIELKELARHFDVTPVQMNADLTTLWMCGLPGYTPLELMQLDFQSGYVSIGNASTLSKPRMITFQECVALLLGLDLITSLLPDERQDLKDAAESLREGLTNILGLPIKLSVVPETSGAVSTAIAKAIEINGGLHIRYHSMYRDLITERTVMPVNLYESNDHQYVRAFCFSALDYREFRVDRIDQATAATVSSEIAATSGNAEKINYSISILGSSRDVMERFSIPPSAVGSSLDLSSYSQQWIERSVMASGSAAKLNSPLDIRAEVARKARLMLDRYIVE